MNRLFDLHAHFSFKPANSKNYDTAKCPDSDHWSERFKREEDYSELMNILDKTVVKSSQINGDSAMKGGFRLICNSLYPIERGFILELISKPLSMLTGHSEETLLQLSNRKLSYFDLLQREYVNLFDNQGSSPQNSKFKYTLVQSYDEFIRLYKKNPDHIYILNSIEGAHAFASDLFYANGTYINMIQEENKFKKQTKPEDRNSPFEQYITAMIKNIDVVKSTWTNTPLFVTLSHHYYNHLAGHAKSLDNVINTLAGQNGSTLLVTPKGSEMPSVQYFDLGIQKWGYKIIGQLLSRHTLHANPTRRILIDLKHMSVQARFDFYKFHEFACYQKADSIPIIFSHAGISGRKSLKATIDNGRKLFAEELEAGKYFYKGDINLFDEEINLIIKSDGIIGLMIDERRIMGDVLPPEANLSIKEFNTLSKRMKQISHKINKLQHEYKWGHWDEIQFNQKLTKLESEFQANIPILRRAYFSVIFRQIFHIISVGGKDAWNYITLGTDYDGVINPIDIYLKASDMADIRTDLLSFWNEQRLNPDSKIAQLYTSLLQNEKPETLINKFLWLNGINFMKKYFNDSYLLKGIIPATGWALTPEEETLLIG